MSSTSQYSMDNHPTDETLAAYSENRLSGKAQRQVMEHVDHCDECWAVWGGNLEWREVETNLAPVVPYRRVAGVFGSAIAVAAAAAVVILLWSPLGGQLRFWQQRDLRKLIDASAELEHRPFEPRLSADFPYKPKKEPKRDAGDDEEEIRGELTVESMRVLNNAAKGHVDTRTVAAAHLFLRHWDRAVETLEAEVLRDIAAKTMTDAIAESTSSDLLNDLSVAYIQRGEWEKRPEDFERALEAAARAWTLEAKPAIAFNRALAIDRLRLPEDAKKAWNDYLNLDLSSPWAAEAKKKLARLNDQGRSEQWNSLRDHITAADAARDFPQQFRERIQNDVFPKWSAAVLRGDESAAAASLSALKEAAAVSDDPAVRDIIPARSGDIRPIAEALRMFEEAESLSATNQPTAAMERYQRAANLLRLHDSPFADVAWHRAASAHFLAGDHETSLVLCRDLLGHTKSVSVHARALWLAGLNELALGRPYESLRCYREALAEFEELRESDNVAAVRNLVAEALDYLGDEEGAATERYAALTILASEGKQANRLLQILNAAGRAAIDRGNFAAADLYLRRQISAAETRKREQFVINALLWRGVLNVGRGDASTGNELIEAAAARAATLPADRKYRDHILSNVDYVRAIAASASPAEKLASVDRALQYAAKSLNHYRAARLWLERGRLCVAEGRRSEAEEAFRSGIDLLTSESGTVQDDDFRGRYFDARRALYEEWVSLALEDSPDKAFALADSLKSRAFHAGAPFANLHPPNAYVAGVGMDQAVVTFVVLRDHSAVWALHRGGTVFATIPIGREALSAIVTRFVSALERDQRAEVSKLARLIYRLLVEPIEKGLENAKEVTFVADGPLNALPFAALRAPSGEPLIQRRIIASAPSCMTYFEPARRATPASAVVIIADPEFERATFPNLERLPDAKAEATTLSKIYPRSVVLTGRAATAARFRDACDVRRALGLEHGTTGRKRAAPGAGGRLRRPLCVAVAPTQQQCAARRSRIVLFVKTAIERSGSSEHRDGGPRCRSRRRGRCAMGRSRLTGAQIHGSVSS